MRSSIRDACLVVVALAAMASPAAAQVCHRGTVDGDTVRWESTFARTQALVEQLPREVVVERIEGGWLDANGVHPSSSAPVVIHAHQSRDAGALMPPLVRGAQRVVLEASDHDLVAFTPSDGAPTERYVGYDASPGLDATTRDALDAACGPVGRGARIYLDASSFDDLRGDITDGSDRGTMLLVLTALVLGLGMGLGVVAYRRLTHRAQVEYADAMLDKRFRDLEERGAPHA